MQRRHSIVTLDRSISALSYFFLLSYCCAVLYLFLYDRILRRLKLACQAWNWEVYVFIYYILHRQHNPPIYTAHC